jgi:hypothetical protein
MGATLTIGRQEGTLLIAFTAFFIGLVATRFWRVTCWILSRIYPDPGPHDALHHQRQAVLRNSPTSDSALWLFCQLSWSWRKRSRNVIRRTSPTIICATVSICAFIAAGGFSSRISSGITNAVLLKGNNCAIVYTNGDGADNTTVQESLGLFYPYTSQMVQSAAEYARQCYLANASSFLNCDTFVQSRLASSIDINANCPFDNAICRSSTSNLRLDTGVLDSREAFGVNSPDDERIGFRMALHCAPLKTEGFSNETSNYSRNYTQYYYGKPFSGSSSPVTAALPYTYKTRTLQEQYSSLYDNGTDESSFKFGIGFALLLRHTSCSTCFKTNPFPIMQGFQ